MSRVGSWSRSPLGPVPPREAVLRSSSRDGANRAQENVLLLPQRRRVLITGTSEVPTHADGR